MDGPTSWLSQKRKRSPHGRCGFATSIAFPLAEWAGRHGPGVRPHPPPRAPAALGPSATRPPASARRACRTTPSLVTKVKWMTRLPWAMTSAAVTGSTAFTLVRDRVGVRRRVVVHPPGEGLQVALEGGRLRRDPGLAPLGDAHGAHPAVRVEVVLAPVLGGPAPGLAVETEDQVPVARHLRPPLAAEDRLVRGAVDVGHAPGVPQDLVAGGSTAAGMRRRRRRARASSDGDGEA